jgi:hypothetical protein
LLAAQTRGDIDNFIPLSMDRQPVELNGVTRIQDAEKVTPNAVAE